MSPLRYTITTNTITIFATKFIPTISTTTCNIITRTKQPSHPLPYPPSHATGPAPPHPPPSPSPISTSTTTRIISCFSRTIAQPISNYRYNKTCKKIKSYKRITGVFTLGFKELHLSIMSSHLNTPFVTICKNCH